MNVSLYGLNGDENLLTPTANGYTAQVTTDTYRYETSLYPEGYGVKAEVQSGFAVIDGNAGTLLCPSTAKRWWILLRQRRLRRHTQAGDAFGAAIVGKRADRKRRGKLHLGIRAGQHVLCLLRAGEAISRGQRKRIRTGFFRTAVAAKLLQSGSRAFSRRHRHRLEVAVGDKTAFVNVVYAEFAFSVRGDVAVTDDSAVVLAGSPVTFYAVAEVAAENVTYRWNGDGLQLDESQDGASCTVTAAQAGSYSLTVTALKNGVVMDIYPVTLSVQAVVPVSSVQFKSVASGLAMQRAVAGYKYSGSSLVRNSFTVDFFAYYNGRRCKTPCNIWT